MSQPIPDPTRWLAELMNTEHVMWPTGTSPTPESPGRGRGAVDEGGRRITPWQLEALKTFAAPWTALLPGARRGRADHGPAVRRRGLDQGPAVRGGGQDLPRPDRPVRKALDAAPLDERSKAQWGFALRQVADALSPANTLATNPEALQLAMETGGASLARGHAAVHRGPGQGPHLDDRRHGVRGRPQRLHDAGQRGLPERADPADPVHADHRQGLQAAAGDRAAVHQQVLHPRSAAGELLRRARGRAGPHGVPGVLAQRRPGAGQADLGRLPRAGRAEGDRRGAGDHRRRQGEHPRVLRRRHPAGQRARGAGGARRAAGRQHDAADHHAGLHRHRRDRPAGHRGEGGRAGGGDRQGRPAQGQRAGAGVRLAAGQRPDLAVRRQGLPEGPGAAGVRPAVLEQRRHQPARADVLLVRPQHLPGEQAPRARRHHAARRAGRPRHASTCRRSSTRPRKTTSCRGRRPTRARSCCRATPRSCSAPAATSPG